MTPQLGIGQRMRLETIDRRLAALPLRAVLFLLAQVAYRADNAVHDKLKQAQIIQHLFPQGIVGAALARLQRDPNVVPLSSQVAMNLATRALVHCRDDAPERIDTNVLARQLGGLLLSLADHTSRGDQENDTLQVELARLDLYFRLSDASGWYEIANDLLFDVLPYMTADRDWVDADAVIRDAYGIDLELFWALTLGFGSAAAYDENSFDLPGSFESEYVTEHDVAAWMQGWSIELADARERARADLETGSWWSFTALYDQPIIKLTEQRSIVVRPAFLANKATPAGMFWAVRNPFVAAGGAHHQWAQFFGRAIEAVGRRYALELLDGTPMLRDEDEIRARWGPGRACDLVLLGDSWVAIDFVHHQITKATATIGNIGDLIRDATMAAVDKLVRQVDETLRRGLAAESDQPSAIYPMVVIGNPFPLNPVFLAEIKRLIDDRTPVVIGVDPRCRPPAILELQEFSALLQVAAAHHVRRPDRPRRVAHLIARREQLPELAGDGWSRSSLAGRRATTTLAEPCAGSNVRLRQPGVTPALRYSSPSDHHKRAPVTKRALGGGSNGVTRNRSSATSRQRIGRMVKRCGVLLLANRVRGPHRV